MNTEQVLTAQIAAAYWGARVSTEYGNLEMIGVSNDFISVYEPPYACAPDSESAEYEVMYSEAQLLLTPLPRISDEHAATIWDILMPGDKQYADTYKAVKAKEWICEGYGFIQGSDTIWRANAAFDELRRLKYDCGHGSIQSLIESGIAKEIQ